MAYNELFGLDNSEVSEANFETVFGSLHEGVIAGINNECRVNASTPAAMPVEVETGVLVAGGVFIELTATEVLAIGANASGQDRIDRIVARRTNATNAVAIAVLQGTPGTPPSAPALTRAGGVYEISLAQVYVANGAAQINPEDIKDEREDCDLCGYVSGRSCRQQEREFIEGVRQYGEWSAYGSGTSMAGTLLYEGVGAADNASGAVTDADGIGLRQDTQNVLNQEAHTFLTASYVHRRDYHTVVEFKFKLQHTTNVRLFVGLTNTQVILGGDDPAGTECAGLQFSTSRPDTNWQFMIDDNVIQTVVDTGVPVDTNAHYVRVECSEDETYILIELFDANHDIQASYAFTANLPALATAMEPRSGIRTLAAAVKSIVQYYARGINRGI